MVPKRSALSQGPTFRGAVGVGTRAAAPNPSGRKKGKKGAHLRPPGVSKIEAAGDCSFGLGLNSRMISLIRPPMPTHQDIMRRSLVAIRQVNVRFGSFANFFP